jgi:hypothetical protein
MHSTEPSTTINPDYPTKPFIPPQNKDQPSEVQLLSPLARTAHQIPSAPVRPQPDTIPRPPSLNAIQKPTSTRPKQPISNLRHTKHQPHHFLPPPLPTLPRRTPVPALTQNPDNSARDLQPDKREPGSRGRSFPRPGYAGGRVFFLSLKGLGTFSGCVRAFVCVEEVGKGVGGLAVYGLVNDESVMGFGLTGAFWTG